MTIVIHLNAELEEKLRARATAEGTSVSNFVQRIIEQTLAEDIATKPSAYELWQKHFTGTSSGEIDRSERAEEILRAMFATSPNDTR